MSDHVHEHVIDIDVFLWLESYFTPTPDECQDIPEETLELHARYGWRCSCGMTCSVMDRRQSVTRAQMAGEVHRYVVGMIARPPERLPRFER